MSKYEQQLEKRVAELEDIILTKTVPPTVHGIMKFLIEEKRKILKASHHQTELMTSHSTLRDITTIKFNLGRQSGHTTALEKINKENKNSLFIKYYNNHNSTGEDFASFKKKLHGSPIQTDLILADDFLYEERRLNELYDLVVKFRDKTLPYPVILAT